MNKIFKEGEKTTFVAGSGTLFFAITKGIVGFLSGSVVLLADAVHSGADALSTFLAWIGLKIAQKEPTDKFPFGFYKAENITALIISFLIFYAGFHIAQESWSKLFTSYELSIPIVAIIVAALDGLVMFLIGTYELKSGRRINSQSLIADGKESRLHLFSSGVVLLGLLGTVFGWPYVEGIAGLVISLFVFQAGFESLRDSVFALMDVSPSKDVEKKVKEIINKISGIDGFSKLKLRKSGPFIFGEVTVKIARSVSVQRADEISSKIEQQVCSELTRVDSFVIHITTADQEHRKLAFPVDKKEDLGASVSNRFGRAVHFVFVEIKNGEVINKYTKDNPYREKEVRAGLSVAKWILKEGVDGVVVKEIGPISLHTLRDNIVEVYQREEGQIKDLLKMLNNNELKALEKPTRKKD